MRKLCICSYTCQWSDMWVRLLLQQQGNVIEAYHFFNIDRISMYDSSNEPSRCILMKYVLMHINKICDAKVVIYFLYMWMKCHVTCRNHWKSNEYHWSWNNNSVASPFWQTDWPATKATFEPPDCDGLGCIKLTTIVWLLQQQLGTGIYAAIVPVCREITWATSLSKKHYLGCRLG
jgi:hypothetical protein